MDDCRKSRPGSVPAWGPGAARSTTPETLDVDVGWARDLLAEHGIALVTVHARLSAHLGNLDAALEERARAQAFATARLADALMPPGRERLVSVHFAPTVPIGDVAARPPSGGAADRGPERPVARASL